MSSCRQRIALNVSISDNFSWRSFFYRLICMNACTLHISMYVIHYTFLCTHLTHYNRQGICCLSNCQRNRYRIKYLTKNKNINEIVKVRLSALMHNIFCFIKMIFNCKVCPLNSQLEDSKCDSYRYINLVVCANIPCRKQLMQLNEWKPKTRWSLVF